MTADILVHLLARFVHISSAIVLLGGVFFARQVLAPVLNRLPADTQTSAALSGVRQFRGTLYWVLGLLVASGLYNFLTGPKHIREYHMWFGFKMLLVLHVLATAILWATSTQPDRNNRRLLSLTISGFAVVLISAYLRSLSQRGL